MVNEYPEAGNILNGHGLFDSKGGGSNTTIQFTAFGGYRLLGDGHTTIFLNSSRQQVVFTRQ